MPAQPRQLTRGTVVQVRIPAEDLAILEVIRERLGIHGPRETLLAIIREKAQALSIDIAQIVDALPGNPNTTPKRRGRPRKT